MVWTILTYHDVDEGAGAGFVGLGSTCPPDVFECHVQVAAQHGSIVSPEDAVERVRKGERGPWISFWFDDGLRGVVTHAAPILRKYHGVGAVAVCSGLARGTHSYWRAQLSAIVVWGGASRLRAGLAAAGIFTAGGLAAATLDVFSPRMLEVVNAVYDQTVPADEQAQVRRRFLSPTELRTLRDAGWSITNHTASHFPVGESSSIDALEGEFRACEEVLIHEFGTASPFWVLPFDRIRDAALQSRFRSIAPDRYLVLMGEKNTRKADIDAHTIHRFSAPNSKNPIALRALLAS